MRKRSPVSEPMSLVLPPQTAGVQCKIQFLSAGGGGESFMDLQLDVKGRPNIYASFDK
jgi:hypothetical protein